MNHAADETLLQIVNAIVTDPELFSDWQSVVVVFKVAPGYVGDTATQTVSDGTNVAFLLDDDNESINLVTRLQQLTKVDDRDPWVACRISVTRAGLKFNVEFEYEDPTKWDAPLPF